MAENGSKKCFKAKKKNKKNNYKKGGKNLGKKERDQIKKLMKILEGWVKEEEEKTKIKSPWREKHEKETVKEDKDDKEEKEDEVDDQEASSSESSLESDEDSDAPAAAQPP